MGAVADGKIVVARIQDVSAFCAVRLDDGLVVAGHVPGIEGQLHRLRGAGGQLAGLADGDELHGGFFHIAGGIRGLEEEFHGVLAGDVTGVGDLDGSMSLAAHGQVHGQQLLRESGVGEAVAEGIGDFLAVIPGFAVDGAFSGLRVALVQERVLIAGLIVLVALVDALGLDQVGIAVVEFGDRRVVGRVLRVQVDAEVDHGRRAHAAHGVGVGQLAGGVRLAGENGGRAEEAVVAGIADPDQGVDLGIRAEGLELHGAGGVDQDDDLGAVRLGGRDQVLLILGQGQGLVDGVAVQGALHGRIVVRRFGAVSGDQDHRHGVIRGGQHVVRIDGERRLADVVLGEVLPGGREEGLEGVSGNRHAEEAGLHAERIADLGSIQVHELLVDVETGLLHRLHDAVLRLADLKVGHGGGAHHTAQDGHVGVEAPERDFFAAGVQGQRFVLILQEHSAFRADLHGQFSLRRLHLLQRPELRNEVVPHAGGFIRGLHGLVVVGAQHAVDAGRPVVCRDLRCHGECSD